MIFYCKHKYGTVQADGYQYCEKCGRARSPEPVPCSHRFKTIDIIEVFKWADQLTANIYVLQCEKCGIVQQETIKNKQ